MHLSAGEKRADARMAASANKQLTGTKEGTHPAPLPDASPSGHRYWLPGDLQTSAATNAAFAAPVSERLLLEGEADGTTQGPTLTSTHKVMPENTHGGEAQSDVAFP